jgi:FkbM family methyltransferase
MSKFRITYAQNREDIILSCFFSPEEIGFYVDVGAEAPTDLSVTKLFYDRGWRGINIEPIKKQYKLFTTERPRDINLNVGISNKNGTLSFREYEGPGYSTFSNDLKDEHEKNPDSSVKEFKDYEVKVMTLKEVLKENNVTSIQFLKVDVEGLEYEVLKSNDWDKYRPEVICIEANHVKQDWRKLLKDSGYSKVFFDGLNEYYTDNKTDRASKFNYVDTVIFQKPIVDYRAARDLERYEKHIDWLDDLITGMKDEIVSLKSTIDYLHQELDQISSLKRHIKKSLKHRIVGVDYKIINKLSGTTNYQPEDVSDHDSNSDSRGLLKQATNNDTVNFSKYNQKENDSPLLKPYIYTRKIPKDLIKETVYKQKKQ